MDQFKLYSDAQYLENGLNWMYYNRDKAWTPSFDVIVYNQKGSDTYLGHLPARVIDALCFVPSIDSNKEHSQMADHLFGQPAGEWQRTMKKSRILGIGDFWADEEKYIVNPVIIGVQENIGYQMENMLNRTSQGQKHQYANHQRIETATITLEPWQTHTCGVCGNSYAVSWQQLEAGGHHFCNGAPKWLWSGGDVFGTRCPNPECEDGHRQDAVNHRPPLLLIDGQHRIRGLNSESTDDEATRGGVPMGYNWDSEQIAFTLLKTQGVNSFPAGAQARIFSDINTTAKDLDMRHKMYMAYRYQLEADVGGKIGNVNLGLVAPAGPAHSDRIAYEAALRIIGANIGVFDNPLHNRISPLETFKATRNGAVMVPDEHYYVRTIMSFEYLFKYIESNQKSGFPFHQQGHDQVARLMKRYFEAVRICWQRQSSDPATPYFWVPTHQNAPNAPPPIPYAPQGGGLPNPQVDYQEAVNRRVAAGLAGPPTPSEIRAAASSRLWNAEEGIISHAAKDDASTITMRILKDIFPDVVFLSGWRIGNPLPAQANILGVFQGIQAAEWQGTGWTTQPTDTGFIVGMLRDYLYSLNAAAINARFTDQHGAVHRPEINPGNSVIPFLDSVTFASHQAAIKGGIQTEMPSGVTMEMQRYSDMGHKIADINDFIGQAPIAQPPLLSAGWTSPKGKGNPTVTNASTIDFFVPINAHGNAVIVFTQIDPAGNQILTKTRHIKPSLHRYKIIGNYRNQPAINDDRNGVYTLHLEPNVDYQPGKGIVHVSYTVKNLAGENTDMSVQFNA